MVFPSVDLSSIKKIDFGGWIIGFIEGEGSFNTNRSYPLFSLFQGDIYPLLFMREFLNVGSIHYIDKKHGWIYGVYGRNCWPIRILCDGKLFIKKKIEQFEAWKKLKWISNKKSTYPAYNKKYINFSDWLIGFIEAEGSFTASQKKYPEFSLAQMKERGIFEKIKSFFGGIGNIRKTYKEGGWQYTISNIGCWVVRNFCEGKLISNHKKKQFSNWKNLNWTSEYYLSQIVTHKDFSEMIYRRRFSDETKRFLVPSKNQNLM